MLAFAGLGRPPPRAVVAAATLISSISLRVTQGPPSPRSYARGGTGVKGRRRQWPPAASTAALAPGCDWMTPSPRHFGQGPGRPSASLSESFPEPLHRSQRRPGGRGRRRRSRGDTNACSHTGMAERDPLPPFDPSCRCLAANRRAIGSALARFWESLYIGEGMKKRNSRVDHRLRRGDDFHSRGRGKPSPSEGLLRKLLRTGHGSACRSQTRSLQSHSTRSQRRRVQTSEHVVDPLERVCQRARDGGRQTAHRPPETGRPCGQHGEFTVYSKMKIGGGRWHTILHCGD